HGLAQLAITAGLGFYVYQSYGQLREPVPYASEADAAGQARAKEALTSARTAPVQREVGVVYDKDVVPTWVSLNWTGKQEVIKDNGPAKPPEVVKKQIKIEELLQVIYFQVDTGDAGGSRVLVRYVGELASYGSAELRVADTLPAPHQGIAVVAITTDSVEFSFSEEGRANEVYTPGLLGEDVIFVVPQGEEAREQQWEKVIREAGVASVDTRPKETSMVAPGVYVIGTDDEQYLNDNFQSIMANDVRTQTRRGPNGERAGIEVMEVRQGSFAQRHGVNRGDVVISINGYPVNSEQEAIQWAKDNGDGISVFTVVVERLGRIETLTYRKPDNQQ
ncbi:MAG TPA: PDZ domain-containing protein, partial [Planctomycetota bacterium]|nr:PDZ domain-containing protein [Planctomycetota bacterium]